MHNQMRHCAMPSSSTRRSNLHSSLPPLQGSSADNTPSSSTQPSPTVNLTCEYTLAKQTDSYSEIWSKIHPSYSYEDPNLGQGEAREDQQLAQVLNPSRECVQEALRHATPSTLTRLVSTYFDHSENTSHLCLLLHDNVQHARSLYYDLHNLLDVLPLESDPNSLTQAQCDRASDIFLQFDQLGNPFPRPDSHNFHDMRHCFSQLNQQLHHRLCKSRSRVHLLRRAASCSAICFNGTVVGYEAPTRSQGWRTSVGHVSDTDTRRTRCGHVSDTLSNVSFFFEFFQLDTRWTRDDTFWTRIEEP
ncbi:hypothetical protein ACSBR2_035497 [Camellia fascicularis]